MQTVLGANGQIGQEIAKSVKQAFTSEIRLVSRQPRQVNGSDQLFPADLLDADQAMAAVAGSNVVFMAVGLPMDTRRWQAQWPVLMDNVLNACSHHGARLVFFDNTYMYPQTATPQTENTPFAPHGPKGLVRAGIANRLLAAMKDGRVEAMICRPPEFYGPGDTQSITNATVLEPLRAGKPAKVFLRDDTRRTLIYTPDASRATALLGNTPDAFGQTWHLPCDDHRPTYRALIEEAARVFGTRPEYRIVKRWQLALAGLFNPTIRDAAELLPRYAVDNLFVSDKFKARFPDFRVTPWQEGLAAMTASGGA